MQKDILQKWFFEQPSSEIWEYLTKPELIELCLMKTNFKPVVGYKFSFTFVPKSDSQYSGTVHCEVLELIPFTKLSYSWYGNMKDGSRAFNSKVVWTLFPKDPELNYSYNTTDLLYWRICSITPVVGTSA